MSRRIVLSLAIAIAALLLGLILAFFSRRVSPPEPTVQEPSDPAPITQPAETPVTEEPQLPQSPAGYLLRDYEGRLAIFREGNDTPEMIFDVYTRLLPSADQERLAAGISAPDYETLTR
ncbi:MAG TPA: hypothetical protein DCP22_00465, partial [Ruminococcaceae bacterium]|nr:hypothetical protein [Oscillospiraceae bacterium]